MTKKEEKIVNKFLHRIIKSKDGRFILGKEYKLSKKNGELVSILPMKTLVCNG